jgi:hypothetical protein
MLAVSVLLSLVLIACNRPVSAERAYAQCSEQARLAERPRGSVGIGGGTGGMSSSFDLTVTSDFLRGRDPYVVYDTCFRRLTGAGPTRPLIL